MHGPETCTVDLPAHRWHPSSSGTASAALWAIVLHSMRHLFPHRSRAGSFSMCLRYSSRVVAPMHCRLKLAVGDKFSRR